MPHKWTADDFCNELVHVGNLLDKRPTSQIGQAAWDTLKQRFTSFNDLTPSVVSGLYDKLEACRLAAPMKEEILGQFVCDH